jgi:hypothetical protein
MPGAGIFPAPFSGSEWDGRRTLIFSDCRREEIPPKP